VHLSATSWQLLKDSPYFETTPRGKIDVKVSENAKVEDTLILFENLG